MKKILIATFFGVLGLCGNNVEASSQSSSNEDIPLSESNIFNQSTNESFVSNASQDENDDEDGVANHSEINSSFTGTDFQVSNIVDTDTPKSLSSTNMSLITSQVSVDNSVGAPAAGNNPGEILDAAMNANGLNDGGNMNTVVDAIDRELLEYNIETVIADANNRKKIIRLALSIKNKGFNIFRQIKNAKDQGANIRCNINTLAEIISSIMKGEDGVVKFEVKDCDLNSNFMRVKLGSSLRQGVDNLVGRKETSKDMKLDGVRSMVNNLTTAGIVPATDILHSIGTKKGDELLKYVQGAVDVDGSLQFDVKGIEDAIRGLEFQNNTNRRKGMEGKEPREVSELRARMIDLLKEISGNVRLNILRSAEGSIEGMYMLIHYLWSIGMYSRDNYGYLMPKGSKVNAKYLLDFYILCTVGDYNNFNWERDKEDIAKLNERLKELETSERFMDGLRNVFDGAFVVTEDDWNWIKREVGIND